MGIPSVDVIDNFNRANENPVAGRWPNKSLGPSEPKFKIVSNQLQGTGAPSSGYIDTIYGPNTECWVTVIAEPAADFDTIEIFARCLYPGATVNPTLAGYRAGLYHVGAAHQLFVSREDNDVATTLDDQPCTFSLGDKIGMRCIGSSITGWIYHANTWTQIASATDATYPGAGVCGLAIDDAGLTTILDNFAAGTADVRHRWNAAFLNTQK